MRTATIIVMVLFILAGLFCALVAFMAPGIAVSGSGCGKVCEDRISMFESISWVFFILAFIAGLFIRKREKTNNDQKRKDLP